MNNKYISLFLIYGFIVLAFIPIIEYVFSIGMYDPARYGKPTYFLISIFSCSPGLLILGGILLGYFKGLMQKLTGSFSVIVGILWLVLLVIGLAAEQGYQ